MPLLDLFWTIFMFFIFVLWIYLLITIVIDIFRSEDLGGGAKALWLLFVIIVPFLGVLIYVIVRGQSMQERAAAQAVAANEAQREYIQSVSGGSSSAADQLAKLADLQKSGVLTDAEFQAQKDKLLA
jgi:hypothetical protein